MKDPGPNTNQNHGLVHTEEFPQTDGRFGMNHVSSMPQNDPLSPNEELPPGWEIRMSNSKKIPYFFHVKDKVSQWTRPLLDDNNNNKQEAHADQTQEQEDMKQKDTTNQPLLGRIRAAHLLVKHRDSRKPMSWRENPITKTKEEAIQELKEYERQIRSGEITLGELASKVSDCSSYKKRGDLGVFGEGDMQKPFEVAAFNLQPGEVSSIVETASGLHLIQRDLDYR